MLLRRHYPENRGPTLQEPLEFTKAAGEILESKGIPESAYDGAASGKTGNVLVSDVEAWLETYTPPETTEEPKTDETTGENGDDAPQGDADGETASGAAAEGGENPDDPEASTEADESADEDEEAD